jgi:hypothetical protein
VFAGAIIWPGEGIDPAGADMLAKAALFNMTKGRMEQADAGAVIRASIVPLCHRRC